MRYDLHYHTVAFVIERKIHPRRVNLMDSLLSKNKDQRGYSIDIENEI